jgi:hypothetical protein
MAITPDPTPVNLALTGSTLGSLTIDTARRRGFFDPRFFDPAYFDPGNPDPMPFGDSSLALTNQTEPGGLTLTEE